MAKEVTPWCKRLQSLASRFEADAEARHAQIRHNRRTRKELRGSEPIRAFVEDLAGYGSLLSSVVFLFGGLHRSSLFSAFGILEWVLIGQFALLLFDAIAFPPKANPTFIGTVKHVATALLVVCLLDIFLYGLGFAAGVAWRWMQA